MKALSCMVPTHVFVNVHCVHSSYSDCPKLSNKVTN